MQDQEVIDWGEDIEDDGDVISLGGSDTEVLGGVGESIGESAVTLPPTDTPKNKKDTTTTTDHNMLSFDGPRLDMGWILRISSVGEPYFYNTLNHTSVWRCPGYTQPAVGAGVAASAAGESGEKRRRLSHTSVSAVTPKAATPNAATPKSTPTRPAQRDTSSSDREPVKGKAREAAIEQIGESTKENPREQAGEEGRERDKRDKERDERDIRQLERVKQIERMERSDAEKQQHSQHNRQRSTGEKQHYSQYPHYNRQPPRQPRNSYQTHQSHQYYSGRGGRNARQNSSARLPDRPAVTYAPARGDRGYRQDPRRRRRETKKEMTTATATTVVNNENRMFNQPTIKHKKSKQFLTPFNDSSNLNMNKGGGHKGLRHYASTSFINQQPPPPPPPITPQQPQASPTYAYFPLPNHPLDPYAFEHNYNNSSYFHGSPSPTTTTFADFTRFLPPPPPPPQQPPNNYLVPSSPNVYPVRQPGLQHKHSMPTLGSQQAPLYENYLYAHAHSPQQPPTRQIPQLHQHPHQHQYQPPQTRMRSMRSNQHLSTNRSAVLEDFRVNGKHTKPELHNIFGYVTEFATDQLGSRFIQQKLDNAPSESFLRVFEEIFPNAVELSSDVFGNYVIQKLFEHGSAAQRRRLVAQIAEHIPTLSFQMYGCRVVQKAVECVGEAEQMEIVGRMEQMTERAVQDQNANHVIQRIIEQVDPDRLLSLPVAFAENAKELASHPYGCRVLQRSFEHIGQARSRCLIEALHEHVDNLVVDMFGNYVIQYLLEFGDDSDRSRIIVKINHRFFELARHKFASNVCEKALIRAGENDREMLIHRLVDRSDGGASLDGIPALMKDQYGNYVLQRAISVVGSAQAGQLIETINEELEHIRKSNQIHNMSSATAKHVLAIERLLSQHLVRITNQTAHKLNICLKHVAALHFENSVEGGSTIKLRPGKVWFTLEVKMDTGKSSQYSATKSAMTIGIISLASIATVVGYGAPAAIAASGAAAGTAAGGTAAGTSASAGAVKFFTSQSGNIAKLSSFLVGKSAKKVSEEYGGMSAVQEEVLSIVKSPDVDSMTRSEALKSLAQVGKAYKSDRKNKKEMSEEEQLQEMEKRLTEEVNEARKSRGEAQIVENTQDTQPEDMVSKDNRKSVVRVHGLYVKERMELEVFVRDGKLTIKDKLSEKVY
ncbi:hypothetical protein E3P77_00510 [Wallemia ichthyophaga]|nr:hypothetical protein E3P77_00510 [Wallemia ichthyophaga]